MENTQPFGFIENPMEINFKSFNSLYFPPYHKPMCAINQILKVSLFSVFDLSIQLRERPNQEIFFYYTEPALLDETIYWLISSVGIGLPSTAGLLELNKKPTEK